MMITWILIGVASLLCAGLGLLLGFMLVDPTYRRVGLALAHFLRRVLWKAFVRTLYAQKRLELAEQDAAFSGLARWEKVRHADPRAREAAAQFKSLLREAFGGALLDVYVFGSRARGDYTPWSDVDVLLIFEETASLRSLEARLSWAALCVLLQHGLLIQPRSVGRSSLASPGRGDRPLIERALQTGLLV